MHDYENMDNGDMENKSQIKSININCEVNLLFDCIHGISKKAMSKCFVHK